MSEEAAQQGVNWLEMRIVTSPDFPDGLAEIRRHWTLRDLYEAQLVQDYIDLKREKAAERDD